jgi:hypothetical protein
MLKKISAFWRVLRTGEEVANPAKWKRRQITAGVLVAFLSALVALADAFGFRIETSEVQLEAVALGILSIYGLLDAVLTAATSKRAGLLPPSRK